MVGLEGSREPNSLRIATRRSNYRADCLIKGGWVREREIVQPVPSGYAQPWQQ